MPAQVKNYPGQIDARQVNVNWFFYYTFWSTDWKSADWCCFLLFFCGYKYDICVFFISLESFEIKATDMWLKNLLSKMRFCSLYANAKKSLNFHPCYRVNRLLQCEQNCEKNLTEMMLEIKMHWEIHSDENTKLWNVLSSTKWN